MARTAARASCSLAIDVPTWVCRPSTWKNMSGSCAPRPERASYPSCTGGQGNEGPSLVCLERWINESAVCNFPS